MDLSIINDPLALIYPDDLLMQDIYILLSTPKSSIPFEQDYGVDLEKYIHEFNADGNEIRALILSQINTYCSVGDNVVDVTTTFFQSDDQNDNQNGNQTIGQNICLVDIIVNNTKVFGLAI